jgi:hypothetical protein
MNPDKIKDYKIENEIGITSIFNNYSKESTFFNS